MKRSQFQTNPVGVLKPTLERNKGNILESGGWEIIVVPKILVILDDAANKVQQGLSLHLLRHALKPGPSCCQSYDRQKGRAVTTHLVILS